MKKTVKKEQGKEQGKEEVKMVGEKEENHAKQEVVESKGAKKKVDLETKPATKKKERTKSENDAKLKVSPNKARSTSQSRWKTLNNNLPAKVNKKVEDAKECKDDNDNTLKVRSTPKTRSISRNRRRASPEKKKLAEKVKLEVKGTKLQKPPLDSNKQKMDLLFAAHCNWGTEEDKGEDKGISAYQLTRWLKNVNLLRPKVKINGQGSITKDDTLVVTVRS